MGGRRNAEFLQDEEDEQDLHPGQGASSLQNRSILFSLSARASQQNAAEKSCAPLGGRQNANG
jgi:hypothetical protein